MFPDLRKRLRKKFKRYSPPAKLSRGWYVYRQKQFLINSYAYQSKITDELKSDCKSAPARIMIEIDAVPHSRRGSLIEKFSH
jgi:hypothetical protein